MEKLLKKIDILKKEMSKDKRITEIKKLNKKLQQDKTLIDLIEKYNITKDENVKKQILENKIFKEYKEAETELNILILEINKELKTITNKGKCSL